MREATHSPNKRSAFSMLQQWWGAQHFEAIPSRSKHIVCLDALRRGWGGWYLLASLTFLYIVFLYLSMAPLLLFEPVHSNHNVLFSLYLKYVVSDVVLDAVQTALSLFISINHRYCIKSLTPCCHPSTVHILLVGNSLLLRDHCSVISQLNLIKKSVFRF